MDWLIPAIILTLLGTTILALVYAYLYQQFHQRYLLIWTAGWMVYAGRYVFELLLEWSGGQIFFSVASQTAALLSGLLLLWGTYNFLGRRLPRRWILATGAGVLWTLGAAAFGSDFFVLAAPTYTLLALTFIWTGRVFLRAPMLDPHGRWIIGWAFILWGIHKIDYPILRGLAWYAPAGFMFAAVLEVIVAVVFLLIYFQRVLQERRQGEERYSTILRTTMDGYWLSNKEGWILDVNDACCQLLGYTRTELLALNIAKIGVGWRQNEAHDQPSFIWHQKSGRFESQLRRKDGSLLDVEISVSHQPFESGGMVLFIRDITARKISEQALKESEGRFRQLVENLPAAIIISRRGVIDFVTPAYTKIFGYEPGEVQGQNLTIHLAPEVAETVLERNSLREDGKPIPMTYETLGQRKDRTILPLLINAKTIQMADGPSTLAMISDLSLIRQVEAAARLSETRFKAFFEYSQAGMVILDKELRFVASNEALARMVGLSIENFPGHTICEILPDFDTQDERIIRSIFAGGPPVENYESGVRSTHRGGQYIYYQASFFPLKGDSDEIVSVGIVILDRTVRHEVENILQERVAELEVVSRVSTILRSPQNLKDQMPEILEDILSTITAQAGAILFYDQQTAQVEWGAAHGWVANIPQQLVTFQRSTLEKVLKVREPLILEDLVDLPDLMDEVGSYFPQNWGGAIFPLLALDEPVGVLAVLSPRPFALDDSHVRLLGTLAEMLGGAVQRIHLSERTHRNLRRLAALHEIDTIITSSLDLRLTLEVLLGHALNHLGVSAVEILKFNQPSQHLEPLVSRGFRTSRTEGRFHRLGQGPAGRALVERRMVEMHLDDEISDPSGMDPLYRAEGARSVISLPLISKGQVVGVIVGLSREKIHFDGESLDFFATLASQAALAIEDIGMLEKLRRSNLEMGQSVMATLQGLAKIVELRKQEPEGHTEQLVDITLSLAAVMEVPQSEWLAIRHGVLLHDVGLMWVSDQILLKDGPLSPEEWAVVQRHTQFVYDLFSSIAYLRPALNIPYCHHEKWDGSGYPRGLKGDQIPLSARMFAVVEAWDSMQVSRPFREALPVKDALDQIVALSGTHYDPQVVEKFLALLAGKI